MKVEVLGPGCKNCETVFERVEEVVQELGLDAELNHVTDINEAMEKGVTMTPGIMIDDEIVSEGQVPSKDKIKELLQ